MAISDSIKRIFGGKRSTIVAPLSISQVGGFGPDFGVNVSNDSALRITAYYAGVRFIAENIASLPKRIYIPDDKGVKRPNYGAVHRAIAVRPNSYTNAYDFWMVMAVWLMNKGNAYALIQRNPVDNSVELHQIDPANVRVTLVNGHKYFVVSGYDEHRKFLNGTWADYQMIHIMQFSLDGITGVNPIVYNAISIGKGEAIEKFIANYFKKGGDKRAVLETDGTLGDEAYARFMEHFNSTGTGGAPLLEYGIKYKQMTIDPVTEALVNSEIFSIQDIARMLNLPPHILAELSRSTFSNIEQQNIQLVMYSLRPLVKRIEVELQTKFYSQDESVDVKFLLDGLLRGDTTARTAMYHNALLDGWMSRNEVRALEGLPWQEGLDDYMIPANENIVGQNT